MKLRTGSFCTGICAPEVAWHTLGWTPAFFSEIDPFASAVEAHRFPAVRNFGDMTAINPAELPDADVWVAGTPCQAFSVAGLRRSLSDDRGNLTLHFVKLVHARHPLCVVWENVPGVLSIRDNAFGCFLAGLVGEGEPLICGDGSWPDAGMVAGPLRSAAWRVLDAQYLGLAQRRRRVFVISFRTGDGINPGAVLFEPEGVRRHSPPSREAGTGVAGTFAPRTHGGGGFGTDFESDGGLVPSLTQNPHADGDHDWGKLIPSTGDVPREAGDGADSRGLPVITHSLRADGFDASEDGTGRGTPLVPVAFNWQSGGDCRINPSDDLANGLQREQTQAVAIAYGIRTAQTSANGIGVSDDMAHTLDRASGQAVAIAFQERGRDGGRAVETQTDLAYSLTAPNGGGRRHELNVAAPVAFQECQSGVAEYDSAGTLRAGGPGHDPVGTRIREGMAVRRLTPRECERLQGFPDDYTLIPYRSKPASDGPRYRALGNSMAVPVLRWIGERIEKVLTAHAAREAAHV